MRGNLDVEALSLSIDDFEDVLSIRNVRHRIVRLDFEFGREIDSLDVRRGLLIAFSAVSENREGGRTG